MKSNAVFSAFEHKETPHATLEHDEAGFLKRVNEYEYLHELGQGTKGVVSLCRQKDENGVEELVAIKSFEKSRLKQRNKENLFRKGRRGMLQRISQFHSLESQLEGVRKEIAIMKKVSHRHIVRLLDVIDDPSHDTIFVVMEYVGASTVMVWDPKNEIYYSPVTGGCLPSKVAARYTSDIISGISYLHFNRIVHRDLKPENILVNSRGQIKIADFGLGHYFGEELQKSECKIQQSLDAEGTWCFWSPEICSSFSKSLPSKHKIQHIIPDFMGSKSETGPRSGEYNHYAADMWALGVCLWCFLYGSLPFYDREPEKLFFAICHNPLKYPVDPAEISNTEDKSLLKVLLQSLLSRDVKKRITAEKARDSEWLCELAPPAFKDLPKQTRLQISEVDLEEAINRVNHQEMLGFVRHRLLKRLENAREKLKKERIGSICDPFQTVRDSSGIDSELLEPVVRQRSTTGPADLENMCKKMGVQELDELENSLPDATPPSEAHFELNLDQSDLFKRFESLPKIFPPFSRGSTEPASFEDNLNAPLRATSMNKKQIAIRIPSLKNINFGRKDENFDYPLSPSDPSIQFEPSRISHFGCLNVSFNMKQTNSERIIHSERCTIT